MKNSISRYSVFIKNIFVLLASVFLVSCSTCCSTNKAELKTYIMAPAIIINVNDGIDEKEAWNIVNATVEPHRTGYIHPPTFVKYMRSPPSKRKGFWLAGTLYISKTGTNEPMWVDKGTGAVEVDNNVTLLDELQEKPCSKVKIIKKGIYQLYPPETVDQSDGINQKEADMILNMYNYISLSINSSRFYSGLEIEGTQWLSRKVGHYAFQTMEFPIIINQKGDLRHGKTYFSLNKLISSFEKISKENGSFQSKYDWKREFLFQFRGSELKSICS